MGLEEDLRLAKQDNQISNFSENSCFNPVSFTIGDAVLPSYRMEKSTYHKIVKNNINQGHPRASILLRPCLCQLDGRSVGESMAPVSSHAPMLLSSTMACMAFLPFPVLGRRRHGERGGPLLPPIILVLLACLPVGGRNRKARCGPSSDNSI